MIRNPRDPARIEPLYRAHFDAIYRYASCRVGREAALDVTAETFHQALRSLTRFDPGREERAWLFGIATNVLRHHRRTEARRLRAYERSAAFSVNGTSAPAAESDSESRRVLVDALRALNSDDRETLLLLAWADLTYEGIARALEIPIGTVRSRINRARRLMHEAVTRAEEASSGVAIAVGEEA